MSTIVLITAGKEFSKLLAVKPTPSAFRHRPIRTLGGRYVCPWYAQRFLLAPIRNNFLLVKTSAGYIITKLTDSTQVNFSQSECFVSTRSIFMFTETFQFYIYWSCVIW